jgi:hypothetical protein
VLNVLVLAMLAGIHFKFLQLIFGPDVKLSMLTQMLLAGIVTLVFLLVGRPMKRMWQMVELSVGAVGASLPTSSGGGIFSRFRRNKGADQRGPQDEFWDNLRDEELAGDTVATTRGGRRPRPEATGPVLATAERLDRRTTIGHSSVSLPSARGDSEPMITQGPGGRNDPAGALPPRGRSRIVDTTPVYDRDWGEDAMVVPSRVSPSRSEAPAVARATPRPADVEMVAGRPVHVVYRPSRGLEVREQAPRRMPLRDGPRETDAAVR